MDQRCLVYFVLFLFCFFVVVCMFATMWLVSKTGKQNQSRIGSPRFHRSFTSIFTAPNLPENPAEALWNS